MANKYTYSIINDFPNQKVNSNKLTEEIEGSDISTSLEYITTDEDTTSCDIWFESELSSPDSTSLDSIIANHLGESVIGSQYKVTAGEDLGSKKAVYLSGSNEVKLACANSESTIPCIGFTEHSADVTNIVTVYTNDVLDGFSNLTPGAEYYLSQDSTSAGEITATKPTTGIIIRVGVAKTSSELDIHILRLHVFDPEYHYASSLSESSTTSTEWQEKLQYLVPSVPAGKYKTSFTAELKRSGPTGPCDCRLIVDDSEHAIGMNDKPPYQITSSFVHLTFATPGTHEIKIQWRSSPGGTGYIKRARFEFRRVS